MRRVSALTCAATTHMSTAIAGWVKKSVHSPLKYGHSSWPTPQWRQHTPTALEVESQKFLGSLVNAMLL